MIETCDKEKRKLERFKEIREIVQSLNLTSDFFLSVALEDKKACEYVLRILMGKKSLRVCSVKTQYSVRQVGTHSVVLDVLAEDSEKKLYEIEVQTADNTEHVRRVRYITGSVDTASLDKGIDYGKLPELHIFYITTFDLAGLGKTVYHVERKIEGTEVVLDNGVHEHYVNTAVDDGTDIAELMKYFAKSDSADITHGALSQRVIALKGESREGEYMCEIIEKLKEESRQAGIIEGEARGERRGEKRGEKRGEARGIAKGRLESMIASVDNVMNKLNLSLDKACDTIGITVEEYRRAKK